MRRCPHCHQELNDTETFCESCGKAVPVEKMPNGFYVSKGEKENSEKDKELSPNIPAIVASICLVISTFLPYYSTTFGDTETFTVLQNETGKASGNIILLIIAAFALISAIFNQNYGVASMGGFSIACIIGNHLSVVGKIKDSMLDGFFHWEIGFYCLYISAIAIILAGGVPIVIDRFKCSVWK